MLVFGLLVAACAAPRGDSADVRITAGRVGSEWRVLFRHDGPIAPEQPARIEFDRLALARVTHSPDLRAVAVEAWENPGTVTCRWPDGRRAGWTAGGPLDTTAVVYRLLDEPKGLRISTLLPHAVPVSGLLALLVEGLPEPAGVRTAGRVRAPNGTATLLTQGVLDEGSGQAWLALPVDDRGALLGGVHRCVLELEGDREVPFLVGVDSDGVLTAPGGYAEILGGEG